MSESALERNCRNHHGCDGAATAGASQASAALYCPSLPTSLSSPGSLWRAGEWKPRQRFQTQHLTVITSTGVSASLCLDTNME